MEPDPVFKKALDNFKRDLTAQQCREFGIATLQDVKDEVNKIQNQHGSAKKLRGMSRMSKFLEAMQQLEQVISVFLNVSAFVAFVWVASSRLEILECLLDTFTDISEAIPGLQGYVSIFQDQPEVLEVLERCYGDIIQFYHMAFGVLGRPGAFGVRDWRRMFDSVWKTFRTKFSPILGSLRRHRELLEQVKSTATFGELKRTRLALQETIKKSNEELKQILDVIQQKRKQVMDKLGSQGPRNDKRHQRLPDQRYPTSGNWILEEQTFLQWLNPNDLSNDLLYLNGMPGAGKTTLVSRILDSLTKNPTVQQQPLLNFYFEHGQDGKTLMVDMLRSFIEQLLQQDDAIVDDLHETVLPARSSDLSSLSWLEEMATRIILAQKRCYIVVDGLDECGLAQRKQILQWLRSILSESKDSKVVVKVLVSGQRDGIIDALLQDCSATIRLDDQKSHLCDIEAFSASVLTQIKDRFPDLEEEEEILKRLDPSRITEASKGMFMYAKVVLDNFLSQTSIFELEQELKREYPKGLDEAYDRVAERVLDKTPDSRKRAALQILGLIAFAARPLKWREIQCYFCIDAVNGTCDPRRRKVGEPKDLCSSFVESEACTSFPSMPSEAQLMMVHSTAKSYLLQSRRLDVAQQHMQMSIFCFQYLTSSAFNTLDQDSKIMGTAVLTGFYGLFDYAAAHWDHHLLQYGCRAFPRQTTPLTEEMLGKPLSKAWLDFVKRFRDEHELPLEAFPEHEVRSDASVPQPVPLDIFDTVGESCNIQEMFRDYNSTRRSTRFEDLAVNLRRIMQQTDLETLKDREKAVYLSLNGPFRPKCSRRACVHFNTGFEREAELSLHISWHEMNFKCPHMGCYAWLAGFPTGALLQTHLKRVHPAIESEERLFPGKSRIRSRTLLEACRLGDMEEVRSFSFPVSTEADMAEANRALQTAARNEHFAICIHLMQQGANPYAVQSYQQDHGRPSVDISVIQMTIRLGDFDLFSALRSAAREHYEAAFIERPMALSGCILDALESPNPQFLVIMLAWNGSRAVPLTLEHILLSAGLEAQRQNYGRHHERFHIKRRVLIGNRSVQEGLQTIILSELERYRNCGQSPELCYEQVMVKPDAMRRSLLHRLCEHGLDLGHTSFEAVRFILTKLRPEDTRRYDLQGNPPLFTAMRNKSGVGRAALKEQTNIIRSFFEKDSDGAKNTRNAAGQGPLEFACRYAAGEIFSLVAELCGATYGAIQYDDILTYQLDRRREKRRVVFGLDCVNEIVHVSVELHCGEVFRFICWLIGPNSEPEVHKMLESLILHLPQEKFGVDSDSGNPTSNKILRSGNTKPAKVLLGIGAAEKLPERCRPELGNLGRTCVRKLLTGFLRAKLDRFDIVKLLLHENEPALRPEGRDPKIVSLLRKHGGYTDFSGETQDQLIQILKDSFDLAEEAGAQDLDGLTEYVETLIQYADAAQDLKFMASLKSLRQSSR